MGDHRGERNTAEEQGGEANKVRRFEFVTGQIGPGVRLISANFAAGEKERD